MEYLIGQEFERVELPINPKKTKRYSKPKQYKIITGCAISLDGKLRVPNKLRKDIINGYKSLQNGNNISDAEKKSLAGKIQAARQIEPSIFPHFVVT